MAMDFPYPAVLGEFLGVLGSLQITNEDRDLLVSMVHRDVPANLEPRPVFPDDGQASSLQSSAATSSHTINGRRYNVMKRRRQAGHTSAKGTKLLQRLHASEWNAATRGLQLSRDTDQSRREEQAKAFSPGLSHSTPMRADAVYGPKNFHSKVRSQTLASKQVMEPVRDPSIAPDATDSLSEDGHFALIIPWQSSDLPLWVTEMNSENSSRSAVHEEVAQSVTPNSFFSSGCSTPSESRTEQFCATPDSFSSSDCSNPSEIRTEQHEWPSDYIKIPWSEQDRE